MKRTLDDCDMHTESDDERMPDKKRPQGASKNKQYTDALKLLNEAQKEEETMGGKLTEDGNESDVDEDELDLNTISPEILLKSVILSNLLNNKIEEEDDEDEDYDEEDEEDYLDDENDETKVEKFYNHYKGKIVTTDEEEKDFLENRLKTSLNDIFGKETIITKILKMDVDDSIRNKVLDKYISTDNENNTDSLKVKNWINNVLKIPFKKVSKSINIDDNSPQEIGEYMDNMKKSFDKSVYGQEKTKEVLMELLLNKIINSGSKGKSVGLVGPPGIGKTTLIQEGLSEALGKPCINISLAGVKDVHILTGHSFTYEGSQYGKIVEGLMEAKCSDPIFFFDEVDKIDTNDKGVSVIYKLIELIDISQNHGFEDEYFQGIPLDLSKCTFIFSMNNLRDVNPILLNRIEMIHLEGFDYRQKLNIAKKFLIPKSLRENKLDKYEVEMSDYVIKLMINLYVSDNDKGVRKLKEMINKIFRRISLLRYTKNVSYKLKNILENDKLVITENVVKELLKDTPKKQMLSYYM